MKLWKIMGILTVLNLFFALFFKYTGNIQEAIYSIAWANFSIIMTIQLRKENR